MGLVAAAAACLWEEPAVVCVAYVCGDYVSCDVAHCSDVAAATCLQAKLVRTPELPFACLQACTYRCKVFAQPGVLPEEPVGASALQHLERARDAHRGRQAHKQVHMVSLHLQFKNLHPVLLRDFPQKTLAVASDHCELERIHCILGLCQQACTFRCTYEMECILPYSVAMSYQMPAGMPSGHFHFLSPSSRKICIAHANPTIRSGCANYAAHPLLRTSVENKEVTSKASERVADATCLRAYLVRNSSAA